MVGGEWRVVGGVGWVVGGQDLAGARLGGPEEARRVPYENLYYNVQF